MKNPSLAILIGLLLSLGQSGKAQRSAAAHSFRRTLASVNTQLETALVKKDVRQLLDFYDVQAVCMPEYHQTLFTNESIRQFFQHWLDSATVKRCSHEIYEVLRLQDYLVESGTFQNEFTKTGQSPFVYTGKYMRVWKIGANNQLRILSEIWGATDNIDRARLPLSTYTPPDTASIPKPISSPTASAIHSRNKQIARLIVNSDGAAMSDFYCSDAIYMPYYSPMLIGIKLIRDYYIEHENPAVGIDHVAINASRIVDLKDYVLVDGYYDVHWHAGNAQGIVTGKNVNVWRKDSNQVLKLYRQMVCHD